MLDKLNYAFEDNLDNEITQKEVQETVSEEVDANLDKVTQDNTEEAGTENDDLILFYELNNYLKDYPIEYTETPLLKSLLNRLCINLKLRENDSVIIAGSDGCGKTSLVYYYTEKVNNGTINECTVLEISPVNFPDTTVDIINGLIMVAASYVEKGMQNIIFFFDDFQKFPGYMWTNYSTIVKRVVNAFDEDVHIKFIIAVDDYLLYQNEELSQSLMEASILYNIRQEAVPEEIISVLSPRIAELLEYHGIEKIEPNVLYMIYSMESASSGQSTLAYEVFIKYLDKILANFSNKGKNIITFKEIIDYYLDREYKGDFFKKPIKSRRDIAKHEAGHTLIALLLPEFLYLNSVTVIGIANTGYSGLTLIVTSGNTGWQTKKNYIKFAAFYLAGRYAEGNMDAGSQSDIEKVNYIIRTFILTTGLFDELGKEFYWDPDEYDKLSSKKKKIVDELTQKIIKKARKYAKKKIKKHEAFLKVLSEKLYEEMFLSREDVLKLWSEYK